MKEGKKARSIQLPVLLDKTISDLALKNKRSVNREIEFLIESAIFRLNENITIYREGFPNLKK